MSLFVPRTRSTLDFDVLERGSCPLHGPGAVRMTEPQAKQLQVEGKTFPVPAVRLKDFPRRIRSLKRKVNNGCRSFGSRTFSKNTDKTEEMYIKIAAGMIRQEWEQKDRMEQALRQDQRALAVCMERQKQLEGELKNRR
jgi:hypothetical protein